MANRRDGEIAEAVPAIAGHDDTPEALDEIRRLLIERHRIRAAKVTMTARIVRDLGVDGDDAAELLRDLHDMFGTDFAALDDQWRQFFPSEGGTWAGMLIGIPAIVVLGFAGGLLAVVLGLSQWLMTLFMVIPFIGGGWLLSRWLGREPRPLTVAGLAEIVKAGRWPADPADVH